MGHLYLYLLVEFVVIEAAIYLFENCGSGPTYTTMQGFTLQPNLVQQQQFQPNMLEQQQQLNC